VQALLEADEVQTFTKLFDLPPEIRQMVYGFYMCEFGIDYDGRRKLYFPSHPPLARVNRMLRQEVLSIYYETFLFFLRFSNRLSQRKWEPEYGTQDFLSSIPSPLVGKITQLDVMIDIIGYPQFSFHVIIDIRPSTQQLKVYGFCSGSDVNSKKKLVMAEKIENGLREKITSKIEHREGRKLQLEDIYAIPKVVKEWKKEVSLRAMPPNDSRCLTVPDKVRGGV
jgi:hypothetical protein